MHLFTIGFYLINPEYPSIRVYNKELKQINFPLYFKICATELNNFNERYQKMGYSNEHNFFNGYSRFERNIIGWGGHNENGSTLYHIKG